MTDTKPTPEQERAAREWWRKAALCPDCGGSLTLIVYVPGPGGEPTYEGEACPCGVYPQALARLLAEREAVLVERCKRLEEALGCVLDLDKLLGDTVLHHPKRNEWEQAYKGACREARAALEDK